MATSHAKIEILSNPLSKSNCKISVFYSKYRRKYIISGYYGYPGPMV